jgi:RHS repeat-associated protein
LGPWNIQDGPYSHQYDYDQFGNMTYRHGWGGEVQGGSAGQDSDKIYTYSNNKNQRDGFSYDASGNLTNDQVQTYSYDAMGQQATATTSGYFLSQGYDGDGLRLSKVENGAVTHYLRSTVLGGAVVAEIDGNGGWSRGYVYAGSELLAVQQNGVYWSHEDSVTKSKRITDVSGNVVSTIELDPWGANTNRSTNSAFMPQSFTSYIRDANGGQDAMARRYSAGSSFAQPDPYEGSYDFANPQSLNRYRYTTNDPVNFRDPTGMMMSIGCGPGTIAVSDGNGTLHCVPGGTVTVHDRGASPIDDPTTYRFIVNSINFRGFIAGVGTGGGGGPQQPGHVNEIERLNALVDSRYAECARGLGNSPAPSQEATKAILSTSLLEGTAPALLAVTWNSESGFKFYPDSNADGGGAGDADIGPMQIDYNTFHAWSGLSNLNIGEVYGTTTTGSEPFNGNPYTNLRAAGRILNAEGRGRTAAGRYRVGSGPHSRTARGRTDFRTRARTSRRLRVVLEQAWYFFSVPIAGFIQQ